MVGGEGDAMYNKSITFFMVRCVDSKDLQILKLSTLKKIQIDPRKTVMCMVINFIIFCFPKAQGSYDVTGLCVLICKFPENEFIWNFTRIPPNLTSWSI